jgi:hypothetical protein
MGFLLEQVIWGKVAISVRRAVVTYTPASGLKKRLHIHKLVLEWNGVCLAQIQNLGLNVSQLDPGGAAHEVECINDKVGDDLLPLPRARPPLPSFSRLCVSKYT